MMTFRTGDHVEYFNAGKGLCATRWVGRTGVVVESKWNGTATVRWDNQFGANNCSIFNLRPTAKKYDPNQQGDKDDDI
jgi:hypothetical protein